MLIFQKGYGRAASRARGLTARLPTVAGAPIRVHFAADLSGHGPIHAGALLRQRRVLLEKSLLLDRTEFARILVHELFHFAWVRLGNPKRRSYERLLAREISARAGGELGWSAEWRKNALTGRDRRLRTRRWREYACESFCDSAAWLFAGISRHAEFTLPARFRIARRAWFEASGVTSRISL